MDTKDFYYFKRNVPYRVGVRLDLRDTEGMVLDAENPYVQIHSEGLRKFLQANKYSLNNGLIVEIDEPPLDTVSPNAITDEEAQALVQNFHQLKRRLPEFSSEAAVAKLLNAAKFLNRKQGTIDLIMARYEEVSPNAMKAVS